jgi:hypothetical protein
MSVENTDHKEIFMGIGSIQEITFSQVLFFLKSEFGTNRKESEKNKKHSRRGEMVIRRGVDRRVSNSKSRRPGVR